MADSNIIVSSLAATGGVGQVALTWSVTEASCRSYLQLDKVEIWASTNNNRANATKVGEVFGTQFVHAGLNRSTNRYYWVRARDVSGNLGDFAPAGATAGVVGTTTSNTPNADVVSDISSNAGNILAGIVTGALVRTAASGARVEMNSSQNALNVYQTNTSAAAIIRAILNNTVASFYGNYGPAPVVNIQNDGNGPALKLQGNSLNPAVLDVENLSGGSGRDAARFMNSGTSGGIGFAGRAASNGGYAYYSQRGGFAPFTGQHDGLIGKGDASVTGDVVVDRRVLIRKGIDDTVTEIAVSTDRGQRGVVGVVSKRIVLDVNAPHRLEFAALPDRRYETTPTFLEMYFHEQYDHVVMNSLGEGEVNVCGRNGNIKVGDLLIASSMRGKTERQDDEVVYSYTVAKAREAVTFDHPDEVKLVACIYLCG
jgi:hypothetical protein